MKLPSSERALETENEFKIFLIMSLFAWPVWLTMVYFYGKWYSFQILENLFKYSEVMPKNCMFSLKLTVFQKTVSKATF